MKRTYQPSKLVKKRRHGFLYRNSTLKGKQIIAARKAKKRYTITR